MSTFEKILDFIKIFVEPFMVLFLMLTLAFTSYLIFKIQASWVEVVIVGIASIGCALVYLVVITNYKLFDNLRAKKNPFTFLFGFRLSQLLRERN